MPIYFISGKILLKATQLQNWCISLSIYISTVPVHYMCSVANQVQVHDVHHSCTMCAHWKLWTCQNHLQKCMCIPILSFTHYKHAGTLVYWHTCVKFKINWVVCPLVFHSINWPPCFKQRCHNLIYHKHLYKVLTRNDNKQLG